MKRAQGMLSGALLLTAANLVMRGVSMVFQVYLTGQVGAAGVGLLQLILTVNAFAVTVGTSGLRVAAMYLSAEEYGLRRFGGVRQAMVRCLGAGVVLSALVGTALAVLSPRLASGWLGDPRAAASLRLLGLTLPLTCVSSILAGFFTACGKVLRLVLVEIGDRLLTVGLTAWLLGLGPSDDLSHSCVSIVAGGALAGVASVTVLLVLMARELRLHEPAAGSPAMGRRLVRVCVPVALNDYLRAGLGTLEQLLIPHGLTAACGDRTDALGQYGVVQGMVFPVLLFPSTPLFAVADLLVPKLSLCRAQGETRRLRKLTERTLEAALLYGAAAAGLLYVLAQPLSLLLYDSPEAARYLRIFAPMAPLLYLDAIVDGMHKGLGQQLYCVRLNTLTALLDVALLFLLLPPLGMAGFVWSFAVTHGLNFWFSLRRLLRLTDSALTIKSLLPPLLAALTAWAVSRYVPTAARWTAVLLGGGLYLTLLGLALALASPARKP